MWINLIKEFLQDLRKQKLRTSLTIIAICWGSIAVVTLLAFGEGFGERMKAAMLGSGNQVMMFYGGQTSQTYDGLDVGRRIRFVEEDMELLQRSIPEIELISPQYGRSITLRSDFNSTNTYMEAVNPGFEEMRTMYPVAGGRFINERDVVEQRRVLFLGNEIATQLFPEGGEIGSKVFIDQNPYTVVGVMQNKIQSSMNNGPDARRAIIPYTTYRQVYGSRFLGSVLIRPSNPGYQERVEARVREIMSQKYQFHIDDRQAIRVWDFIEAEQMHDRVGFGIKIFLFSIGFCTLLIAGVGVANIMYVVVKERTHEIGVKKAIGARNRHIMAQFVFEALLICMLGGGLGLLVSAGLVTGVQSLGLEGGAADFLGSPILSSDTTGLTVGILIMIGLVAGIFPARRAARVNPVESLRYE